MVRKGIPNARARRGLIPTDDPGKDRARMVHTIFKTYDSRIDEEKRISMIKLAEEVLVVGEAESMFGGKDPFISGIAIFVFVCRYHHPDENCPVTYRDIKEDIMHFAATQNFTGLLQSLHWKFGSES